MCLEPRISDIDITIFDDILICCAMHDCMMGRAPLPTGPIKSVLARTGIIGGCTVAPMLDPPVENSWIKP